MKDTCFDRLERTIENQIIPVIGNFLLSQISHNDIQELLNKLFDSGTSYSVIKKTYYALNAVFRYATLHEDIKKSNVNNRTSFKRQSSSAKKSAFFIKMNSLALKWSDVDLIKNRNSCL